MKKIITVGENSSVEIDDEQTKFLLLLMIILNLAMVLAFCIMICDIKDTQYYIKQKVSDYHFVKKNTRD